MSDDDDISINLDGEQDPAVGLPADVFINEHSARLVFDPECVSDKGLPRTAKCSPFTWLHDSNKPKGDQVHPMAALFSFKPELIKNVTVAYEANEGLEGRPPPTSFTSVPSIQDLNRTHDIVTLTSPNVMHNLNIIANALVGFPGCATDAATENDALRQDATAPHTLLQFSDADLPTCAVVWGADEVPYFAKVRKVVRSVTSLREHWAAMARSVDEIIAMSAHVSKCNAAEKKNLAKSKLAMARVSAERCAEIKDFCALMLKRLNALVPPSSDSAAEHCQTKVGIPPSATADDIFLVLYEYTEMARRNMVKVREIYDDMIVGDNNAPMRKYIIERENRRTVKISMVLNAGDRTLTQYHRVPITSTYLYNAVMTKFGHAENKNKKKKNEAKSTPKKAPTVADVAKTTPANTEKAIAHAMSVDACAEKAETSKVPATDPSHATTAAATKKPAAAKKRKASTVVEKPEKPEKLETPERATKKRRAPPPAKSSAVAQAETVNAKPGSDLYAANCRLITERFEKFCAMGTAKRSFGNVCHYDLSTGLGQTAELKRIIGAFLQVAAYTGVAEEVRTALNAKWTAKQTTDDADGSLSM